MKIDNIPLAPYLSITAVRNSDGVWCVSRAGLLRPVMAEGATRRHALIRCWYLLKEQEDELQKMRTTLACHCLAASGSYYQQQYDYGYWRARRDLLQLGRHDNKFPAGTPEHDGYAAAVGPALSGMH